MLRKGAGEGRGEATLATGQEDARNLFAFKLRSKLYICNKWREGREIYFKLFLTHRRSETFGRTAIAVAASEFCLLSRFGYHLQWSVWLWILATDTGLEPGNRWIWRTRITNQAWIIIMVTVLCTCQNNAPSKKSPASISLLCRGFQFSIFINSITMKSFNCLFWLSVRVCVYFIGILRLLNCLVIFSAVFLKYIS